MAKTLYALIVTCVLSFGNDARAEREIENVDLASHSVTGTVTTVFSHDSDENHQYVVQIHIRNIEKGDGYLKGDTIFTYAYTRQTDAPRVPASSGHIGMPQEGQRIRARIKLGNGGMEALHPFWFDPLDPSETNVDSETVNEDAHEVPSRARVKGMRAAITDLEHGILKQKEYPPLPYPPGHFEYVQLLKNEFGIEWETIKIHMSDLPKEFREQIRKALSEEVGGYNDVMRAEIERRFGREIFETFR